MLAHRDDFTARGKEHTMTCYKLRTLGNTNDYMTIIKETEDGYVVRIVRDKDGYNEVTTDFISHSLFDSCERTGYIKKVDNGALRLAANA